jgi:diguanylate cyclase (GGDEF)-like protein
MRRKLDLHLPEQKIFLSLMVLTSMILILDSIIWAFDSNQKPFAHIILVFSNTFYFLLQPIICAVWYFYVDFQINRDIDRIKKLILPLSAPIILNSVLTIMSIFGNYYYYYDNLNVYHRGTWFFFIPVICFSYVAYTAIYVILNRKRIHSPFFYSYLTFSLPPLIGAAIQLVVYGVSLIWIGMTLSLLLIFMNIQNEQMHMDYLTGLFNRRQLDFYLKELIRRNKTNIAGIMLDLNSFKHINDHYGHYTGDEALKYTSKILQKTFGGKAFLSRFGGDEFVILIEVQSYEDLETAIKDLKQNVLYFNKSKELPYKIDFSIGADLYPSGSKLNEQDFLNYIDTLMYKDKHTLLQKK